MLLDVEAVEAMGIIDMEGLGFIGLLNLVLFLASLGVRAFAFADSLVRPADAYPAAGKLTKLAWCAILGVGLAVGLLLPGGLIGLFNIAGLIAAILYLVDVRPAVREIGKPGRNQGPYGSW